ncbi:YfgM family protein [Parvibium lacunae]|uniref:Ancillary SecYEG translocon subunit/Cell division coordinator CpoB TPR domain-containing protein n=1 Tax=Parvibium lacunae TaxID=1888893 RepID=A0A368L9D5_9BURK|nr:tetratricopeptide repeat protein [Parvibium lacunae]RCS59849.1 hypothetical protein DU000_03905 [Parvibium lacunae]
MAYDLEEQEQLANLKAFWAKYGNAITAVITILALVFAGYRAWDYYQQRQAAQASVVYDALLDGVKKQDMAKVKEATSELLDKYKRTTYAQMAALVAAKAYVTVADTRAAKAQLEWLIGHAQDESFTHIARIRLAGLLLDEKAFEDALKLLQKDPPAAFMAQYADRRGDIYLAQNKLAEAKAEFNKAYEALDAESPLRNVIELKRDAIHAS